MSQRTQDRLLQVLGRGAVTDWVFGPTGPDGYMVGENISAPRQSIENNKEMDYLIGKVSGLPSPHDAKCMP